MTRLLVANRGEIALRVLRSARELGLETVAVYSDADKGALHVRFADAACHIGPASAGKSYLNIPVLLKAARESGATAVHPGYGFLAESAAFAQACEDAGLTFIGPRPETIAALGDKLEARTLAEAAGVPVVPGGGVGSAKEARRLAGDIGYPVMVKAAGGGGGKGIRVARDEAELTRVMPLAQAEAQAAFGRGDVYLEAFLPEARHVEVQVLGDGNDVIHVYERECSVQRRRQKLMEEAGAPDLSEGLREQLCRAAVDLAGAAGYRGAGTVEFLLDPARGSFYFIEVNARIQVEHPVTEMVTGLDLVKEQLEAVLMGKLGKRQDEVTVRGHAVECRLNAEDPDQDFRPSPGKVTALHLPGGPGVRVDTALEAGSAVPPFYDSLVAKLVVHAETRDAALAKARRALDEFTLAGVKTTAPLLRRLLDVPEIRAGAVHTRFLERYLSESSEQHLSEQHPEEERRG